MPSSLTQSELEHLLAKAAFSRVYGFSLHSHGDGESTLPVPFRDEFLRPGNIPRGPYFLAGPAPRNPLRVGGTLPPPAARPSFRRGRWSCRQLAQAHLCVLARQHHGTGLRCVRGATA